MAFQLGSRIADRYEILKELYCSEHSIVYLAINIRDDSKVAIKIGAPEDADIFRREGDLLKQLTHRNIVKYLDQGLHTVANGGSSYKVPYIVLEYIDGQSLETLIQDESITAEMIIQFTGDICSALQAAHDHGIVHRDVKPANIMCLSESEPGLLSRPLRWTFKLIDFGIAKQANSVDITPGAATPAYCPYEQLTGSKPASPQTDIYALGVILYRILSGKLPFSPPNPHTSKLEEADLRRFAERLQRGVPELDFLPQFEGFASDNLKGLIKTCLALAPSERPKSVADVGLCFFRVVRTPRPDLSTPPAVPRWKDSRFLRKTLAGGIVAVLVSALVALAAPLWLAPTANLRDPDPLANLHVAFGELKDRVDKQDKEIDTLRDEISNSNIRKIYNVVAPADVHVTKIGTEPTPLTKQDGPVRLQVPVKKGDFIAVIASPISFTVSDRAVHVELALVSGEGLVSGSTGMIAGGPALPGWHSGSAMCFVEAGADSVLEFQLVGSASDSRDVRWTAAISAWIVGKKRQAP